MKLFESFSEFLNETYSSIKELEILSNDIIDFFIKELENIIEMDSMLDIDRDFSEYEKIFDVDFLTKKYKRNFKEIKDFTEQKITIEFLPEKKHVGKSLAKYSKIDINKNSVKTISLKLINDKLNDLVNKIKNGLNIKKDPLFVGREGLIAVLLHELQHAYDDYRSEGKYKEVEKVDIYGLPIEKSYKEYLNLKHEIDARFAQTFTTIDFYKNNKMKNFDVVLKEFKDNFLGFNNLSAKDNKRILSLFGKFYILKKEELDVSNSIN